MDKSLSTPNREFTPLERVYYGFFMDYFHFIEDEDPANVKTELITELLSTGRSLKIEFHCASRKSTGCSLPASKVIIPIREGKPVIDEARCTCATPACIERAVKTLPQPVEVYDLSIEGSFELFSKYRISHIMGQFGFKLVQAWGMATEKGFPDLHKVHQAFWCPGDKLRAYLMSHAA
jgi:hypothetical protein